MRCSLVVAFALLGACGGGTQQVSTEKLQVQYGPQVKARLVQIKAAAEAAEVESWNVDDQPSTSPVALDFTSGHTNNAIVAHREDAILLDRDPPIELRYIEPSLDSVRIAKRATGVLTAETDDLRGSERALDDMLHAKYVLFAVARNVVMPHFPFGAGDNRGQADGVAVLYEIDGTKLVGKFRFHAQNRDDLLAKKWKLGTRDVAIEQHLKEDLQAQTGRAVSQGIVKRWPGAKTPWNWGYGY